MPEVGHEVPEVFTKTPFTAAVCFGSCLHRWRCLVGASPAHRLQWFPFLMKGGFDLLA